jgi:hypothetical protein
MRENCLSGSEGGARFYPSFLPLSGGTNNLVATCARVSPTAPAGIVVATIEFSPRSCRQCWPCGLHLP